MSDKIGGRGDLSTLLKLLTFMDKIYGFDYGRPQTFLCG
jgi:hypothetical protein